MDLAQVRAFLEENKGNAEVQEFVKGLNPITIDKVKDFATSNDEGKTWLQSQKDSFFTKSLDTWKKNNLDDVVMSKVKEMYPDETEEQKRIKLLEQKLEQKEKEAQKEALRNKALSIATEKALPSSLIDFFLGDDEEATTTNLGRLEEVFSTSVQAHVDKLYGENGRNIERGNGGGGSNPTSLTELARKNNIRYS